MISPPAEAVFQIEINPATSQVGQNLTIIKETNLTASDSFTGEAINLSQPILTTALPYDTSLSHISDRRVQP